MQEISEGRKLKLHEFNGFTPKFDRLLEFYIDPPRDGAAPLSAVPSNKADRAETAASLPTLAAHLSAAREKLARAEAIQADLMKRQSASNLDDIGALVGAVNDADEPPPGARHVGVVETAARRAAAR